MTYKHVAFARSEKGRTMIANARYRDILKGRRFRELRETINAFCPTGPGGGVDPTTNNRKKSKPANPLRLDPSRTSPLRKKFEGEMSKRFDDLRRRLWRLVVEEDALGLRGTGLSENAWCPTGEGGGRDNSCSPRKESQANLRVVSQWHRKFPVVTLEDVDPVKLEEAATVLNSELMRLFKTYPGLKARMDKAPPGEIVVVPDTMSDRRLGMSGGYVTGRMEMEGNRVRFAAYRTLGDSAEPYVHGMTLSGSGPIMGLALFRHELGHRVRATALSMAEHDAWRVIALPYTDAKAKRRQKDWPVTKYATTDHSELFSEAFSIYTHAGYRRGSLPSDIEGFMDDLLRTVPVTNAFCPTGEGGGRDNSCSPRQSGGAWMPGKDSLPSHDSWRDLEADPAYVYHATNTDNAADVQQDALVPHRPSFGTDQREWPDGSTASRSYFTPSPKTAWQFAPGYGLPALLRIKRNPRFKKESGTGDLYLERVKVPPSAIEILTTDGWKPLKARKQPTANAFCATGKGGGVDPTCSPRQAGEQVRFLRKQRYHSIRDQKALIGYLEQETGLKFRPHGSLKGRKPYSRNDIDVVQVPLTEEQRARMDREQHEHEQAIWDKVGRGELTEKQAMDEMYGDPNEPSLDETGAALERIGFRHAKTMRWLGILVDRYERPSTGHAVEVWQQDDDPEYYGLNEDSSPVVVIRSMRPTVSNQRVSQLLAVLNGKGSNCGTGAGGFKPGNTCGKGGGSKLVRMTLWRAADDDTISGSASFAAGRDEAETYLNNPGFGGRKLYKARIEVASDKFLDLGELENDEAAQLLEELTGESPERCRDDGPDQWVPKMWSTLDDAGIEWVRVRESYPDQVYTYIYVGGEEPEMQEVERLPTTNTGRWAFLTSSKRLEEFVKWFKLQLLGTVLESVHPDLLPTDAEPGESWLKKFIREAYKKSLETAHDSMKPTGAMPLPEAAGRMYQAGGKAQFMRQAFNGPAGIERLAQLAGRAYDDLDGVSTDLSNKISHELLDGMVKGESPRVVGRRLNKMVDGYKNRGLAIAQTETLRAHNEGQLDGLEALGATHVGAMVEWSTSGLGMTALGNPSPCKLCAELQGMVLTIQEARGLLPRHPYCRCAWRPANVGESTKGQIRRQDQIKQALERSLRLGKPKKAKLGEYAETATWPGGRAKIGKTRPKTFSVKK